MKAKIVTLDVREDIHNGREPFSRILQTASQLGRNQKLRLIAPFQPVPLFEVLAGEGFSHQVKPRAGGDWEILFSRSSEPVLASEKTPASSQSPRRPECSCGPGRRFREVDARGMESGQPLDAILEALGELADNLELKARTDHHPIRLYAHLDDAGFVGRTEEQTDGSFITYIHRCESAFSL